MIVILCLLCCYHRAPLPLSLRGTFPLFVVRPFRVVQHEAKASHYISKYLCHSPEGSRKKFKFLELNVTNGN